MGTNNGSDCPTNRSACSNMAGFAFVTSETASQTLNLSTEIILRKLNQFQSFPHQHRSVLIIFFHLCFLSTPRDNGLVDRKTGCLLSPIPFSSRFMSVEHTFFSWQGPWNDHLLGANLFSQKSPPSPSSIGAHSSSLSQSCQRKSSATQPLKTRHIHCVSWPLYPQVKHPRCALDGDL